MGMTASLEINFYNAPPVSRTINFLLDAGWQFGEFGIGYECYKEIIEMGDNWEGADEAKWPEISRLLDEKSNEGEIVALNLDWQNEERVIRFQFATNNNLHVFLTATRRICGRFTDYSWFLSRIVCPLDAAKYNIHEVICHDSY